MRRAATARSATSARPRRRPGSSRDPVAGPAMEPGSDTELDLAGRRIVVGVCGGIAAYKAVEVARRLTQAGAEVRVVMTTAATQFVGPLTFSPLTRDAGASDLFPEPAPAEIVPT